MSYLYNTVRDTLKKRFGLYRPKSPKKDNNVISFANQYVLGDAEYDDLSKQYNDANNKYTLLKHLDEEADQGEINRLKKIRDELEPKYEAQTKLRQDKTKLGGKKIKTMYKKSKRNRTKSAFKNHASKKYRRARK